VLNGYEIGVEKNGYKRLMNIPTQALIMEAE
jgi:hypothetical protein